MSSPSSDKIDSQAERDDTEGEAERERRQNQQETTSSGPTVNPSSTTTSPQPPTVENVEKAEEGTDNVVDPLEKDIEKVCMGWTILLTGIVSMRVSK